MTNIQTNLPALQEDGLSNYIRSVWVFPILEAEEEYNLAKRYAEDGDLEAAKDLIRSHLRLVVKMAMKFKGYGLPMGDMIAEGNVGLMKAVQKFDPEKGFRLSTYALWWIKASITEYILRSWSMVRMGSLSAQKRLFFSLRKTKERLNIHDEGELSIEDAKKLEDEIGMSAKEITDFNRRLMARDSSLNAPIGSENETTELQDMLSSDSETPEESYGMDQIKNLQKKILQDAVNSFPEREQEIIQRRFLQHSPDTLEAIGESLGISRERVRQLEKRIFENLSNLVKEKVQSLGGTQWVLET